MQSAQIQTMLGYSTELNKDDDLVIQYHQLK